MMLQLRKRAQKFISEEEGATVVEYGVLVALIIAASIAIIIILGGQIQEGFQSFSESLNDVGINPPPANP